MMVGHTFISFIEGHAFVDALAGQQDFIKSAKKTKNENNHKTALSVSVVHRGVHYPTFNGYYSCWLPCMSPTCICSVMAHFRYFVAYGLIHLTNIFILRFHVY